MIGNPVWHISKRLMTRLLAAVSVAFCLISPAFAERLALVVGNANYETAPDLANPTNDATAIGDALTRLGFKVTLLTDAGGKSLWQELDKFIAEAETAESAVFFYSGHAFQMSGVNYLVPVTAKLDSREAAKEESWSLDGIIARLQSRSRQTLIFLDACRNDPLPAGVRGSGAATDGLARVQTGVGTFVAFSTAPGSVTIDGVSGAANSPFTTALLKHIETDGISISDMMIEVRNDVENATLRKQVPWDQSSLSEQFYFVPPIEVSKQELSEADYELLAELSPEDRTKFLALLAESGFDESSLAIADAAIALAEANLDEVADETTFLTAASSDTSLETLAAIDPALDGDAMPEFETVESDVVLGQISEAEIAQIDPVSDDPTAPIRLAALNWNTRDISINDVTITRLRLSGRLLTPDTEENRALLAAIDPALALDDTVLTIAPEELARAVQTQLKRVGCYQMAVDGSWGKGSRTALTSYYLAKKTVPETLEPTDGLFARLSDEPKVVCATRVAKSAVKTGKRTVTADASSNTVGKVDVKSKKKTGKKQETAKTRITKGTIGITGSF